MNGYERVLTFWFNELKPEQWFAKSAELDETIKTRFLSTLEKAAKLELYAWRVSPHGRLAEIIVLDQFSRNIYRDSPRAFANDPVALALSQEAIHQRASEHLTTHQKAFLYMPFMHSESLCMQEKALELFSEKGLEENYQFAIAHKEIIERFGRFPHRNAILGRASTSEEVDFLKQPNSSF